VEAISPTPNDDWRQESSPVKTTKDDILQHINQIDREITQSENQLSKLKKRQQELEALTNKSSSSFAESAELSESRQHSITQIIYSQNRVSLTFKLLFNSIMMMTFLLFRFGHRKNPNNRKNC
jgi:DNA repair ATPase RecN